MRLLTMEVTSVGSFNIHGLTYSEKMDKLLPLSTWHLQQPGQRKKKSFVYTQNSFQPMSKMKIKVITLRE